ncbi:hypothetical protein ACS0TY_028704 [Phlomoides rotata]
MGLAALSKKDGELQEIVIVINIFIAVGAGVCLIMNVFILSESAAISSTDTGEAAEFWKRGPSSCSLLQ